MEALQRGAAEMRWTTLAFAAVLLAACGSDKASALKLQVALRGPSTVQGTQDIEGDQLVYACDFTLIATATGGSPGDVATLVGGHDTFLHQDGSSVSVQLSTASVAELLGSGSQIATGTLVSGFDSFYTVTDQPFHLDLVVYYSTPRSAMDSAAYTTSCL
jgi:hypothetical protein